VIIRDAAVGDAEGSADLLGRIIHTLDIYSPEARRREIAKYGSSDVRRIIKSGIVVVAEDAGKIVGTCLGYEDDALIWLSWFVVDEEYRRLGFTKAMVNRFVERAQQISHKVWCDCRTTNTASIQLLERAGFERIATVIRHWYGQDFILWQKSLDRA